MKSLFIVESPAKAKTIQGYLGKDYVVMASVGHIADLAKGGKNGMGIDIENNFKPHYVLIPEKVEVLQRIMDATKECDQILLGADDDREGHSICWHLQERLKELNKPMKRVVFNKIKKDALLKAIKNAGEINMNIVHSQEARRILDRLVGFTASPFLMNYFGSNLSAGRVQSVVSRMIVDREKEIDVFVPEDFWTIQVGLSKDKQVGFQTKYANRLTDLQTATNIKNKLADKKAQFIVKEVLADEEKKSPAAPLITSSLQQIMSKQHGFGAERTMKAAQSLYEAGYITYMRTDSVRVEDATVNEVRDWLKTNNYPIPNKPNQYKNKDAAQDAHECIHPTDVNFLPQDNYSLAIPDEKAVYQVIWEYFMASQMPPAIYNTLKITISLQNDPTIELKAGGKALKSKGFLEILGIEDNSQIDIPQLTVKDQLHHFSNNPVKMEKKQTQPPPRYSEDKLLKELVNKNIGRPSTFASLLSTITNRNYVEKQGNTYHATELGKKITNELTKFFTFLDYDYSSRLEKQLDDIESGKVDHIEMLHKFYEGYKKELQNAHAAQGAQICPECHSHMIKRTAKKTGKSFLGCSSYPACKFIQKDQNYQNA